MLHLSAPALPQVCGLDNVNRFFKIDCLNLQIVQATSPRMMMWLGELACIIPASESKRIVSSLLQDSYTSVDILTEESEDKLLSGIQGIKAGAMLAFKKKLADLKVCTVAAHSCSHLFFRTRTTYKRFWFQQLSMWFSTT
jgi:hypothetical protein